MNEIARNYAEALFSIGLDEKKILPLQNEVKQLMEIILDNEDFILLIDSKFLSISQRKENATLLLKDFDVDLVNFIKVIIDHNRVYLLNEILEAFNSLANESQGIKEGLLYSAFPLKKDIINKIKDKVSQLEKMDVELLLRIDPTLIGGVKVVINSHVYDGSIKNQLEKMQIDLLGKEQ